MTRADEGEGRYTVVYKGDPAGNRILNGEPAVGRAVGVMLGDLIERAAQAEAEVAQLTAALAEAERERNDAKADADLHAAQRAAAHRAASDFKSSASALRERVATLEAALRPFANYAADMPGADFGEGEIGEYYHDGFRRSICTQDLRAARTALEAPHADK